MMFSLIVATRGRTDDLALLFDTLLRQKAAAEIIVVDQNGDERLAPIMEAYAERLTLRWLRSDVANACHARNLGLHAASGDVMGFPDDDCLYPDGVLGRVAAAFADPALGVLTGPAASPEGGLGSGRWRAEGGAITLDNVWTSVIEFNFFLRRDLALGLGGFDETLGPGTPFGSAEGNDLCARAIKSGARAVYDPGLLIIHPDKRLTEVAVARAALYGAGLGRVLRRHARPAVILPFLIRPVGGMLVSALRLRRLQMAYYAATLRGRLKGLLSREGA